MLQNGWQVRALTRHPKGAAAVALARLGATPVYADMSDPHSLLQAFAGCQSVFAVTEFWEHGFDAEYLHGRNLIAAALKARVDHFVFSSVGGTDRTRGLGITHFDSKAKIEADLLNSGLNWTVLRPVTFLENFRTPRYRRTIANGGTLYFGFAAGKRFQFVAMDDLAHFAKLAFDGDPRVRGKATEIASDSFTMEAFAEALSSASGQQLRYRCLSPFAMRLIALFIDVSGRQAVYRAGRSLIPQFAWNNTDPNGGWSANVDELRSIHPQLMTMKEWVRKFDWRKIAWRGPWSASTWQTGLTMLCRQRGL
jgi:uncharacterized protein YbjT (DUF2867 family)